MGLDESGDRSSQQSSQSSSLMVGVDDALAVAPWPESRFHSLTVVVRGSRTGRCLSAGCSSVGGGTEPGGGLTTMGLLDPDLEFDLERDDAEEVGRDNGERTGLIVVTGIGASPQAVFSYRMATRFMSSRNDGLRTMGRFLCRTLPNLGTASMFSLIWRVSGVSSILAPSKCGVSTNR